MIPAFRGIENSLENDRFYTGEAYIAFFPGDVRDNAKRFTLCWDAIFMLRYLGVDAPGCFYESAILVFTGNLVENKTSYNYKILWLNSQVDNDGIHLNKVGNSFLAQYMENIKLPAKPNQFYKLGNLNILIIYNR